MDGQRILYWLKLEFKVVQSNCPVSQTRSIICTRNRARRVSCLLFLERRSLWRSPWWGRPLSGLRRARPSQDPGGQKLQYSNRRGTTSLLPRFYWCLFSGRERAGDSLFFILIKFLLGDVFSIYCGGLTTLRPSNYFKGLSELGPGYLKDRRSHFDCKELGRTPGVKFDLMGNLSKTHNITEIPQGSGRRNAHIKNKDKRLFSP